jgi:outer membrane lipoprotein-sorting protein
VKIKKSSITFGVRCLVSALVLSGRLITSKSGDKGPHSKKGIREPFDKLVIAFCCALTLLALGCKRNSDTGESSSPQEPSAVPPFFTHEPSRYQAVRTIKSTEHNNEILISRTRIARDGLMRREEYETKPGDKLVYLEIPAGQFVMLPSSGLIADLREAGQSSPAMGLPQDQELDFSPERLLNQTVIETRYQRMGAETVNGRSTTKYRVVPRLEAAGIEASSETLLWVDDALQIPVRWETSTTSNEKQSKTVMELSEISLTVDAAMFELPQNYRKVRPQDLNQKIGSNGEPKNLTDEKK